MLWVFRINSTLLSRLGWTDLRNGLFRASSLSATPALLKRAKIGLFKHKAASCAGKEECGNGQVGFKSLPQTSTHLSLDILWSHLGPLTSGLGASGCWAG